MADNLQLNKLQAWFQNWGLFSDHFLKERLPQWKEWQSSVDISIYRNKLLSLYESKKGHLPDLNEAQTEQEFIKPVLEDILDYANSYIVQASYKKGKQSNRPDYALFPDQVTKNSAYKKIKASDYTQCIGIADAKYWERELDLSKSSEKDNSFNKQNPSFQIVDYLSGTQTKWGILTNGRLWRLYCIKSHIPLANYYQIDLVQLLGQATDEEFKYFYLFFRKQALLSQIDGKCFLDYVFEGSSQYAVELETDIKERAYDVVQLLCQGFASTFSIEQLDNITLKNIYNNSLILLYRLLFIFYAEARELLPLTTNPSYRDNYSMYQLTQHIDELLKKDQQLSPKSDKFYKNIGILFDLINKGDSELHIPAYNGGLFDKKEHGFLEEHAIPDSFLVEAIHQLARIDDRKLKKPVAVDYNTLSERHLGSIYEGLLEFKPLIAQSDLTLVKEKNSLKYAPVDKHPDTKVAYKKGELYLVNDKGERKSTGSYYTPEYIVNYIVETAIDPLVKEALKKAKALKPEVDKAIARWQRLKKQKQSLEPVNKYDRVIAEERARLLTPYLSLKILDPAMGSGHFLVRATDFLAEAIATDPAIEPPVELTEDSELTYYRRRVVENCIYGVDLNPLAVELAKLTLWLRTMAKSKPLSFLNHHLRIGDSLIGARIANLDEIPKIKAKKGKKIDLSRAPVQLGLFQEAINKKLYDLLQKRAFIAHISTETLEDVHNKEQWEQSFEQDIESFKIAADLWMSTYFGGNLAWDQYNIIVENLYAPKHDWDKLLHKEYAKKALSITSLHHFFHWELEFPEVFYDEKGQIKENTGFDAVIGNPPYDVFTENSFHRLSIAAGCGNIAGHFVIKGSELVNRGGSFGMVLPLSVACGDDCEKIRQFVYSRFGYLRATHYSIRPAKLFPGVDQRISILIATEAGSSPCNLESSRLYRFKDGEQAEVVLNAKVGDAGTLSKGYIPRVGDEIGAGIYRKLIQTKTTLKDYIVDSKDSSESSWYFHSVGRYWLKAYDYLPYFGHDGKAGISTTLMELRTASLNATRSAVGVVNSSFFYFWWMLQSDEFHLLRSQVLSFPFPPALIDDKALHKAMEELMKDYRKKAIRKVLKIGHTAVEMDEIHARLSRDYIRAIDKILAPHYQLTDDELSYLDTYDEEFRVSEE